MILLVDAGNTRLKWRVVEDAGHGVLAGGAALAPAEIVAGLPGGPLTAVVVASVRGADANQVLARQLEVVLEGRQVSFLRPLPEFAGLINGYDAPQSLGVDRWLAMVGAWDHRHAAALVVDAGTAVTIDAIARGRHLGGYILPGLGLQRAALGKGTAGVGHHHAPGERVFGRNTADAVANGTLSDLCAAIEFAFVELTREAGDTCQLFVTGGDGRLLANALRVPAEWRENLVLEGMLLQWRARGHVSPGLE